MTHPDLPSVDDELKAAADAMVDQLGNLGVTDAGIALRLARTLTAKGYTPSFLPTSRHGDSAEELFRELDSSDRHELGGLIAAADPSTTGYTWPAWLTNALERVENDDRITALRDVFNAALKDAVDAVAGVQRIHGSLVEAFDVEFAEGRDAVLFETYLKKADLALRTASAINPIKES